MAERGEAFILFDVAVIVVFGVDVACEGGDNDDDDGVLLLLVVVVVVLSY